MLVKFSTFNMIATVNNNTISLLNIKDSEGNYIGNTFTNMIRESVLKLSDRILKAFSNNIEVLDLNAEEVIKSDKKEIKLVPVINNLIDLEFFIKDNYVNTENMLRNLSWKYEKGIPFKMFHTEVLSQEKGYIVYRSIFKTEISGDGQYMDYSILIDYKVRYIKSKDKMIFKSVENIEKY